MAKTLILALDQGTTSSRALLVDPRGQVAGSGQRPFTQHFPRPGEVEHDPDEIWLSTRGAIIEAFAAADAEPADVAAIGVTNQRETLVVWDRDTGEPVGRAIVWQDRRTAAICDELRAAGHEATFRRLTGLTLDPYFTGTKLTWLLRSDAGLRARAEAGEVLAGTVDCWLIWQLTNGSRHVTDFTNASRTLLFNIRRGRWDDALCGLLEVPRAMLPRVQPSQSMFGHTSADMFGAAVPILGVAGDQQAALFGQACFLPGQTKNTYGTGCFLLANSGATAVESRNGLLSSMGAGAGASGPEYVVEGTVFVAGALVQWLRDELGIIEQSADIEALAGSVPDSGGVTIVPAFTGLGAPHWDPHARGTILGLTRGTTKGHIARAALEAIALSSAELLVSVESEIGAPIAELRVDGGAARNDLLMQLQANYSGKLVIRPEQTETTAMGAAYLAGIGAGTWSGREEVASLWRADRVFEPAIGEDERAEKLGTWAEAVKRSLGWAARS